MQEQLAIQALVRTRYGELRAKNSSYSVRAFAKKMGLNSGAVSGIINGKRNVSESLARRICDRLMIDPQERMELLKLFPEKRAYQKPGADSNLTQNAHPSTYLQLSAAQFRVISEWEHFAILALMRTTDFNSDPHWIAKRLRISPTRAEQSIGRLISIGIIERSDRLDTSDEKSGEKTRAQTLTRSDKKFRTTDDISDIGVRRSHLENLELQRQSLERDAIKNRDFTHDTLAIDPKNLSMAKELIRKFQDEFAKLVESGNRTEVYRLSMQFFPLSNLENGDKNENPQ
jgi:uncharacterized protein (TIGR02147 family)